MKAPTLLRSIVVAAALIVALFSVALADDYTIPIVVNGETITLTLTLEDGKPVTMTSAITDVVVGDIQYIITGRAKKGGLLTVSNDEIGGDIESAPENNEGRKKVACAEIVENHNDMTRVQWLDFIDNTAAGAGIAEWTGIISSVEGYSWLNGGYPVNIEVDPGCEVYFVQADERQALGYNIGDEVLMSGEISHIKVIFGAITVFVVHETFSVE